jgi:uncharacterized protein YeaO (DUF488 family)
MSIRVDCYVAVLERFMHEYPNAVFEVITRQTFSPHHTMPSVLSPTWDLLNAAKSEKWPIERYFVELGKQFDRDPDAQEELFRLRTIVRSGKTLFLVCFEKDATKCHRTFVKNLLEQVYKYGN